MKKQFRNLIIFLLCLGLGAISAGRCQEKDKRETDKKSVDITADKGSLTIRQSFGRPDDRFLVESKTYITMQMELLDIKPSETLPLESFSVVTENGKPADVISGGQNRLSLEIHVQPTIVAGKGVRLKVDYKIGPEMKSPKIQDVLVPNGGEVLVELLENKSTGSRIALRITPLVKTAEGAKEYPGPVRELSLEDSYLVLNDDKLIAHDNLSARSDSADIYLFFYCFGKGVYVLSFKPAEDFVPAGVVNGKQLRIKVGEDTFDWRFSRPILPEGKWLVWVRNNTHPASEFSIEKGGMGVLGRNGLVGITVGQEMWKKYFK